MILRAALLSPAGTSPAFAQSPDDRHVTAFAFNNPVNPDDTQPLAPLSDPAP